MIIIVCNVSLWFQSNDDDDNDFRTAAAHKHLSGSKPKLEYNDVNDNGADDYTHNYGCELQFVIMVMIMHDDDDKDFDFRTAAAHKHSSGPKPKG